MRRPFQSLVLGAVMVLCQTVMAQGRPDVQFAPTRFASMAALYEYNKAHGRPTLVTSDSVLHSAHVLFDYTLRAAELQKFDANLRLLTGVMMDRLAALAQEEAGKRYFVAPPPFGYDRVAAYYGVAQKLLDPDAKIPEIIRGTVDQEVKLILAHQGSAMSPVMGVTEDYTQYVPRGHYTRNESFQRFFRAMLWYGRAGFPISGEKAPGVLLTPEEARANAWAAMALARNLDTRPLYRMPNSPTPLSLWSSIYQPTQFMVGTSDDLTPPEFAAVSVKVFGETLPGDWQPGTQAKTDQLIAEAIKLRPPQLLGGIQSDALKNPPVAVRLFGQRVTPDSVVFQRLVHPQVSNRMMPSGLDVMAALGSQTAMDLLRERGEYTSYPQYGPQLDALRGGINALPEASWRRTAYLLWLRTLRNLVTEPPILFYRERNVPAWWNSPTWKAKQLNAALGSWAELRHDTILYTKQTYTATLSMPANPGLGDVVYVEPVPEVYVGLSNLITSLRENLTQQGVFPPELAPNYDEFTRLLRVLSLVSAQELDGARPGVEQPSPDDLALLQRLGPVLTQVETLPEPLRSELTGTEDASVAVIADVHTDPNAGHVLEVCVGYVYAVTVTVPHGDMTVPAYGPIFSYYEFTHPMADRLTDAAWQEMLSTGKAASPFILGRYLPR